MDGYRKTVKVFCSIGKSGRMLFYLFYAICQHEDRLFGKDGMFCEFYYYYVIKFVFCYFSEFNRQNNPFPISLDFHQCTCKPHCNLFRF